MKLLVTGANGFLGSRVVAEALARGHDVMAMVRPASRAPAEWADAEGLEVVRADLRSRQGLAEALDGADAILHLAATKAGDLYAQLAGSVVATENLLAAMTAAGIQKLVHVSTFSVYDYRNISGTLTEDSPLEPRPDDRDDYAKTKLLQEEMVRAHCAEHGVECTVLRPGVVFGPGNEWTARLGFTFGRNWFLTGFWARLPVTYVDNCAAAIVLAAEHPDAVGQTYNVVDDEHPSQRAYAKELQRRMKPRPRVVPIPWTVMRLLAGLATLSNKVLFKGRGKVPGIFVPAKLYSRSKPLRYSNAKLRGLGWEPRHDWRDGLARCFEPESAT